MQNDQGDADDLTFERGSENVFADLGLDNADELLVKADLAIAIKKEIRARGWTPMEAVERTGLTQCDVSRIGKIMTDGFSQERLQNALRRLGIDVEIRIHHRKKGGIPDRARPASAQQPLRGTGESLHSEAGTRNGGLCVPARRSGSRQHAWRLSDRLVVPRTEAEKLAGGGPSELGQPGGANR